MHIRTMTIEDIPFGLALSAQNGWNQLEADWRRQLELEPAGCFMAEQDGRGIGTACACVFGSIAWIALVLVDANERGRGAGTALMRHTLAWLDAQGVPSVRLDATPLGQPIYAKLGFVPEFTLQRYAGLLQAAANEVEVATAKPADLADILALDRRITGTDRSRLIERLYHERPDAMQLVRGPAGVDAYVGVRPGARAWQIGPCLGSANACRQLLAHISQQYAGQMAYLDVPVGHAEATACATSLGLNVQRPLVRMGRGPTVREHLDAFWASYGPEKG